ncbi:pyridoxine 5-phosphate synthase [Candidatus Kinetoplastibacterium blastocrithidii TCC012E]|uniref:Pyridoxine 5'-phosphate synthase n=1 Tax=Candidatus Kinetoplastidibacterium blastocrithidiae TCC012E TaxID=1208922 RepID=M1LAX0_9PROT|nr:pyridoxine 5'-phosphate synthase [Candidatus Kinetoplastibacterium blastocrithidii]AFZ83901.1 pyridoxine 5-phosphate synthase [Candidatus Kinetoplastibacterium blastocrithidii (ex Strigomonas culicis)]AGF49618.1 pyridoxine 5-phosphate synthase [Candidatus Kinetoplastibacterium blastocrithidii TCC012E]
MIKLGVNIDHVATIRQQRYTDYPDPLLAAIKAEEAGADLITLHLREDRRHIQDNDVFAMRKILKTRMNLECSLSVDIINIACKAKPDDVCLVPENRSELTTEGGLDVIKHMSSIRNVVDLLSSNEINVSIFIDPDIVQIEAAAKIGIGIIEIHTGKYSDAAPSQINNELFRVKEAVGFAKSQGLKVNAGHGLSYDNVTSIASIDGIEELNIGHSIISRSIFDGIHNAVVEMKRIILEARNK